MFNKTRLNADNARTQVEAKKMIVLAITKHQPIDNLDFFKNYDNYHVFMPAFVDLFLDYKRTRSKVDKEFRSRLIRFGDYYQMNRIYDAERQKLLEVQNAGRKELN